MKKLILTIFVFLWWLFMPIFIFIINIFYLYKNSRYFYSLKEAYIKSADTYKKLLAVDVDFKKYSERKREDYIKRKNQNAQYYKEDNESNV